MTKPSHFSFCLDPLDVNLVKMQETLLERMKTANRVCGVVLDSIVEKYVSQNPEREYGEITVEIYKYRDSLTSTQYASRLIVANKQGNLVTVTPLYCASWNWIERFIDGKATMRGGWDFFAVCKANILWTHYCIKNNDMEYLREMNDALLEELKRDVDYLKFRIEGNRVYCHGHPAMESKVGENIGDGWAIFRDDSNEPLYLVNTATNEIIDLLDEKDNENEGEKR